MVWEEQLAPFAVSVNRESKKNVEKRSRKQRKVAVDAFREEEEEEEALLQSRERWKIY